MALIAVCVLALFLHTVTGFSYEFLDTSRKSYSIGDDVTLTCPVTLCPGEEYKSVEWVYWSCGRYHFKNYCHTYRIWDKATYSGPKDLVLDQGITMKVPADRSVKPTLTIKNITCDKSAYYHCHVIGTKGTDRKHREDVYLFKNASAEPKLTPDPIIVPANQSGSMQFTCVDEAHVPGSTIRMYHGWYSFRATFTEVPTQCTTAYIPDACHEVATCTASFEMSVLRYPGFSPSSVHCDITRPGGKVVAVTKRAQTLGNPHP